MAGSSKFPRPALHIPIRFRTQGDESPTTGDPMIDAQALWERWQLDEVHHGPQDYRGSVYRDDVCNDWLDNNKRGNSITQYGVEWGLIVPASEEGRQIANALTDLIAHRGGQTILWFDPLIACQHQTTAIAKWMERYATQLTELQCLLIAGSAREIPFELDQRLVTRKLIGRLSFDLDPSDKTATPYRAYAEKLMARETSDVAQKGSIVCHSVWSDKDLATRQLYRRFTAPLLEELGIDHFDLLHPGGGTNSTTATNPVGEPHKGDLTWKGRALFGTTDAPSLGQTLTGNSTAPTLLIATCHGQECLEDPAGPGQGALVGHCLDTFDSKFLDALNGPVLPGGLAFLYACNSAGTPHHRPWVQLLPEPPRPNTPTHDHVSNLAQALLARADGPLAVIGHVDVSFVWGLADHHGNFDPPDRDQLGQHYRDVIHALLEGTPVAAALRCIHSQANQLSGNLLGRLFTHRERGASSHDLGIMAPGTPNSTHLDPAEAYLQLVTFCQYLDTSGWIVLGDPLATLEGRGGRNLVKYAFRGDE